MLCLSKHLCGFVTTCHNGLRRELMLETRYVAQQFRIMFEYFEVLIINKNELVYDKTEYMYIHSTYSAYILDKTHQNESI